MKRALFFLLLASAPLSSLDKIPPITTISVPTMHSIVEFMRSYYRYHDTLKGRALFDAIESEVSFDDAIAVLKTADHLGLKPLIEFAARLVVKRMKSSQELISLMDTVGQASIDQIGRYYFLLTGDDIIDSARISGYSVQDYLDYMPGVIARKILGYRLDLARLHLNSLDGIANIPHIETFRFLELDHNLLTRIDANYLSGFTDLRLIHLQFNKLETIEIGTFCALKLLKAIRLEHNPLRQLNPGVFLCLPLLKDLFLAQSALSPESLISLQESLPEVTIYL